MSDSRNLWSSCVLHILLCFIYCIKASISYLYSWSKQVRILNSYTELYFIFNSSFYLICSIRKSLYIVLILFCIVIVYVHYSYYQFCTFNIPYDLTDIYLISNLVSNSKLFSPLLYNKPLKERGERDLSLETILVPSIY